VEIFVIAKEEMPHDSYWL